MPSKNPKGQFLKGVRYSPRTEFKPGTHWRTRAPWWDKAWLENEYVTLKKSACDIAKANGVGRTAIDFWLRKHGIQRRSISESRKVKRWGAIGKANPMYGRRGPNHHNFQGGNTPYRQKVYARAEWREFMRQVWARDRACKLCGEKDSCEIHHIDPVRNTPLLIMDIGNVILLCERCHESLRGKELRWRKKLFALIA